MCGWRRATGSFGPGEKTITVIIFSVVVATCMVRRFAVAVRVTVIVSTIACMIINRRFGIVGSSKRDTLAVVRRLVLGWEV